MAWLSKLSNMLAAPAAATPTKTVQPVTRDVTNPRALRGVDLATVLSTAPISQDIQNPLFAAQGFTGSGDGYDFRNDQWGGNGASMPNWAAFQGPSGAEMSGMHDSGNLPIGQWVADSGGAQGESGEGGMRWVSAPMADPVSAYNGYTFDWTQGDQNSGQLTAYDSSGAKFGSWEQAPDSATKDFMEFAALAAAGFGGLGMLGMGPLGALGGAGGSIGGSIGAGEGAAQLAAYTAANPLTVAEVMATTLPAGGLPGLGSVGGLLGGLPAITVNPMDAINAYTAANPVTVESLLSGVPELGSAVSSAPSVFNAAKDSQAYNQAAGITGDQAAAAATAPKTVNLVGNGGTMGTAGGVQGMLDAAAQIGSDATASSGVGGMGGNTVGQTLVDAQSWLKDNPLLGRLLTGGATSLLSGIGGGSSGESAAPSGPPVQWNSPLQQGLLSRPQQYAPPAQTRPAGLLAQGYANDGAWRYMGG